MTTKQYGRRPRISPLRYPGGKSGLYGRLRKVIRDNDLAGCTYIEPYAGGAGAGLGLLVTGQVERVVINDLDPAIYAFWSATINEPDYMRERLLKTPLNDKEWRRQREVYLDASNQELGNRALGFATLYLNRTNRSGVLNGGPIGGHDQTGPYKIDARFNRQELVERLRILNLYSDRITVSAQDGKAVIKKYAARKNVFIYADPPYFEKAGSLYLNTFAEGDHESLAKVLNAHADKPWLLTYDVAPQVELLYADRRRHTFDINYSARDVRRASEIVVLSDALKDVGAGWPTPESLAASGTPAE
jgi:DNA adenine methylase